MAGSFSHAGGSPAVNLALWNGSLWGPFGSGSNGPVLRLALHNGGIVAAGGFTTIGGVAAPGGLATFDGTSWQALPTPAGTPTQLLSWNGMLYACGWFEFGGVPGDYVAVWDGSAWSAVGAAFDGPVNDLAVYEGQLLAGGGFSSSGIDPTSCLARWDGVRWTTFNGGTNDAVHCLRQFGPDLYVGGIFTGSGMPRVTTHKVAKWNGTAWSNMFASSVFGKVNAFGATQTGLVAVGYRPSAGLPIRVARVAGSGVPLTTDGELLPGAGEGLWAGSYQDRIHVGGRYQLRADLSGDIQHYGISRAIDGKWHALTGGLNGRILDIENHNGQVIAVGDFTRWKETPLRNVAVWNGTDWVQFNTTFPSGMEGYPPSLLKSWRGRLYLYASGGAFTHAYWNGTSWVASEIPVDQTISMVEFVGDRLMCGVSLGWRQTSAFTPYAFGSSFVRPVRSTLPYAGGYIIGGEFTAANGQPALRVAHSDGTTWSAMGSGFADGVVKKLILHGSRPVAIGSMGTSGSTSVGGIAEWNGTDWVPVGTPFATTPFYSVDDAVSEGSDLYVVGSFTQANNQNGLMKYNASGWQSVGGMRGSPLFNTPQGGKLRRVGNELWITGQFVEAGGQISYQLARYRLPGQGPSITSQPQPVTAFVGDSVAFSVGASGNGLTYDWRLNGVSLGAPSQPEFTIASVTGASRGVYDCAVMSSDCPTPVLSQPARLAVLTADLGVQGGLAGSDGAWNNNDFVAFINLFFAGDPAADTGRQGGVLGPDDLWNNNDFVTFIELFFTAR